LSPVHDSPVLTSLQRITIKQHNLNSLTVGFNFQFSALFESVIMTSPMFTMRILIMLSALAYL